MEPLASEMLKELKRKYNISKIIICVLLFVTFWRKRLTPKT